MVAALTAVCGQPQAEAADGTPWRMYIGTYTHELSEGIYLLELDAETGNLSAPQLAATTENPSFLARHPTLPVLYAVGEMDEGGMVSAFAMDADSGALAPLNAESSEGAGPCHVAVAPSGSHVAVANYSAGSVALLPVRDDGGLEAATAVIQHEGSSVHARQKAPHAHSVTFSPDGRFLFVADLGIDKMMVYRCEGDTLVPHEPPYAALAPGAGPRHFAFHPTGRFAYAVNELDSTVTAFAVDAAAGRLAPVQSVTTLPTGFEESNTTAEIRVHPSGRFLYASNRGHDSIAVFALDDASGALSPVGHTATGGRTPRNFNVSPDGRWLLAANQQSDSVVLFRIDSESGALEATGQQTTVGTPVCVLFVAPKR